MHVISSKQVIQKLRKQTSTAIGAKAENTNLGVQLLQNKASGPTIDNNICIYWKNPWKHQQSSAKDTTEES